LSRLWAHLSANTIRSSFEGRILPAAIGPWLHQLARGGERLGEDLGPVGPAAAAGALLYGLAQRKDGLFPWLGWVAAVEIFYIVGINPMGGVDRQTGIPLCFVGVLAIGLGLDLLTRERAKLRWALLPLGWVALALPAFLIAWGDARVTRSWAPHVWTREALAQLEPGTLLLTQQDDLSAGVLASQVLEGARPDVVAVPGQHLYHPRPDRAARDERVEAVWDAAAPKTDEAGRILAVLGSWRGPSAVESPAVGVMKPVRWLDPWGSPPIAHAPRPGETRETLPETLEHWKPLLETREDKKRLAAAIVQRVSADLALHQFPTERVLDGRQALRMVSTDLLPDDPRTLVSLAALEDRLGGSDEAIALTRRAIELEPERWTAHANLALYLGRDPATRDEARAIAGWMTFRRPDLETGWVRLAEICRAQGDDACVKRAGEGLARSRR
jgi:hypothetical protein